MQFCGHTALPHFLPSSQIGQTLLYLPFLDSGRIFGSTLLCGARAPCCTMEPGTPYERMLCSDLIHDCVGVPFLAGHSDVAKPAGKLVDGRCGTHVCPAFD